MRQGGACGRDPLATGFIRAAILHVLLVIPLRFSLGGSHPLIPSITAFPARADLVVVAISGGPGRDGGGAPAATPSYPVVASAALPAPLPAEMFSDAGARDAEDGTAENGGRGDDGRGADGGDSGSGLLPPVPLAFGAPAGTGHTTGAVPRRVRIYVLEDGSVGQAELADGGATDSLAINAAHGLRFRPAVRAGKPVAAWTTVEVLVTR